MKRIIFIPLLFFTLNSFSQTYYPFPDSVGIWRQASIYGNSGQTTGSTHYSFFINGDTIINTNTYSKLYLSYSISNIDTSAATYFAALREDQKKVYVYLDSNLRSNPNQFPPQVHFYNRLCNSLTSNISNFNRDLLLYDFDVSIGDTITYPYLDSLQITIQNIDSVEIQNQYRKKYRYLRPWNPSAGCDGNSDFEYTEGIGETNGGLFSLWWIGNLDNDETFNCFKDDEIIYSKVIDCDNPTVRIEEEENSQYIKIYPNPTSGKIFIEFSNKSEKVNYSIFDISGKEVASSILNQTNSIDVSNFRKGLYLIKLKTETGQLKSTLISIQ